MLKMNNLFRRTYDGSYIEGINRRIDEIDGDLEAHEYALAGPTQYREDLDRGLRRLNIKVGRLVIIKNLLD